MAYEKFIKKYALELVPKEARSLYARTFYGKYRGFAITLTAINSGNVFEQLTKVYGDFKDEGTAERLNGALGELKKLSYVKSSYLRGAATVVTGKKYGAISTEELEGMLDKIIDAAGDKTTVSCEFCGSQDDARLTIFSDKSEPVYACGACSEDIKQKYDAEHAETENKPNNYIKGILLGLLFSLGGVVLWVLIGALNFIAGIAGYAIAFFMYLGYKKAGGKVNQTAGILIIVLSLVMVAVSTYISTCQSIFSYLSSEGNSVGFFEIMALMPEVLAEDAEFLGTVLLDFDIGTLLTLVATARLYKTIFSEDKKRAVYVIR